MEPSTTAPNGNGRKSNGTFAIGNHHARGNPHAIKIARLRSAMMKGITNDDIQTIIAQMVAKARGGDLACAHEILNRVFGKPVATTAVQLTGPATDNQQPPFDYDSFRARFVAAVVDSSALLPSPSSENHENETGEDRR
jgi:hypothetical protein